MLLVQSIRVDEGAMASLRLGSVVEDPYNLNECQWLNHLQYCSRGRRVVVTYCDHGQQNVAGSGSLERRYRRVDEGIDGRGGEDQPSGEEADNLRKSASASYCVPPSPTAT